MDFMEFHGFHGIPWIPWNSMDSMNTVDCTVDCTVRSGPVPVRFRSGPVPVRSGSGPVRFRLKLKIFVYLKSGSALSYALHACRTKKEHKRTKMFQFPGGGLGNQNPARTIAHSPPGVKETLNYWLREKKDIYKLIRKIL